MNEERRTLLARAFFPRTTAATEEGGGFGRRFLGGAMDAASLPGRLLSTAIRGETADDDGFLDAMARTEGAQSDNILTNIADTIARDPLNILSAGMMGAGRALAMRAAPQTMRALRMAVELTPSARRALLPAALATEGGITAAGSYADRYARTGESDLAGAAQDGAYDVATGTTLRGLGRLARAGLGDVGDAMRTARMADDAVPYDPTNPMDSPNFRNWFGDSKVVDEAGNPLVVYHGTGADVQAFDPRRRGSASRQPDAKGGYFFSSKPSVGSTYAESSAYENIRARPNVVPAFVEMENPLDIPSGAQSVENAIKIARAEGRDGVILRGDRDGGDIADTFIPFNPTQIKSPFNRGTFDPNDPNILHMTPQAQQPAATTREPYWVRMARERARQGLLERAMQDENEREAR